MLRALAPTTKNGPPQDGGGADGGGIGSGSFLVVGAI